MRGVAAPSAAATGPAGAAAARSHGRGGVAARFVLARAPRGRARQERGPPRDGRDLERVTAEHGGVDGRAAALVPYLRVLLVVRRPACAPANRSGRDCTCHPAAVAPAREKQIEPRATLMHWNVVSVFRGGAPIAGAVLEHGGRRTPVLGLIEVVRTAALPHPDASCQCYAPTGDRLPIYPAALGLDGRVGSQRSYAVMPTRHQGAMQDRKTVFMHEMKCGKVFAGKTCSPAVQEDCAPRKKVRYFTVARGCWRAVRCRGRDPTESRSLGSNFSHPFSPLPRTDKTTDFMAGALEPFLAPPIVRCASALAPRSRARWPHEPQRRTSTRKRR